MTETTSLLACTPEEGARRLALRWVDEASACCARVLDGKDPEALHDLRVALRKLRTVLKTYRKALKGAVSKKRLGKLRDLVRATGDARDTEVELGWLLDALPKLTDAEVAGGSWLRDRLQQRRDEAYQGLRDRTVPSLVELLPRLRKGLGTYEVEVEVGQGTGSQPVVSAAPGRLFGALTAELVERQLRELKESLKQVRAPDDDVQAHQGRIHGKRLRYLLEPLREDLASAKDTLSAVDTAKNALHFMRAIRLNESCLACHGNPGSSWDTTGTGKDPWGNIRRGYRATTRINRKDFGLTWNQALEFGGVMVGEDVEIEIETQLVGQG